MWPLAGHDALPLHTWLQLLLLQQACMAAVTYLVQCQACPDAHSKHTLRCLMMYLDHMSHLSGLTLPALPASATLLPNMRLVDSIVLSVEISRKSRAGSQSPLWWPEV